VVQVRNRSKSRFIEASRSKQRLATDFETKKVKPWSKPLKTGSLTEGNEVNEGETSFLRCLRCLGVKNPLYILIQQVRAGLEGGQD
jgi:hypothetical protein